MSKKKHPEHVNHERWLVSYADFITLLFAFFVVLFASGQSDKRKQIKLAESMQSAFRYNGIFDQHSKTPPISDEPGSENTPTTTPLAMPLPTDPAHVGPGEGGVERIREAIREQVERHPSSAGAVTVRTSAEGVVVSLHEGGFFASGSAVMRYEAIASLRSLAGALPAAPVRVEGHTDDLPIHTAEFASNWELSTARAATITRMLIAEGAVDPAHVSAAGYAEFHPVAPNTTEEGRAQNRRVDIVLLGASAGEARATPSPQAPSR